MEKNLKYHPSNKDELLLILRDNNISLRSIDVSEVENISSIFSFSTREDFSGIENWDVSKVKKMEYVFSHALSFNQDLSKWDVSNVEDMSGMFYGAMSFNQDISSWNVSKLKNMDKMFKYSPLEDNPPKWYKK